MLLFLKDKNEARHSTKGGLSPKQDTETRETGNITAVEEEERSQPHAKVQNDTKKRQEKTVNETIARIPITKGNKRMAKNTKSEEAYACASENHVNFSDIQHCSESEKGDELLASNGYRTTSVKPPIRFVPTVIFNDSYNQSMQDMALKNFSSVVDFLIKENCKSGQSITRSSMTNIFVLLALQLFKV
ncbi:unnamed protein product [Acanthoscelides obtectus]|uniref:Uncharacterized protein n=1 Tax=Acanthoscelides obtectus TaxID=200917 RepID=A0A9P0K9I3_ACAOB|nr:unnamed protein product [Acanthoscelides obtectus]CAK1633476.1 GILT-like protein 1 [Acanthoscelides obtectus]